MSNRFDGKSVIVTGSATGIGRASVRDFVREGARVVALDINEADGFALEAELGSACTFIRCDVTSEDQVKAAVARAVAKHGGLNVLVNNAGLLRTNIVTDLDRAVWDKILEVNVTSCFLTAKHAIPHLEQAGGGAIVNMSSIGGLRGGRGHAAYSASKAAVNGLTVSLALEWAHKNIRVNSICPGWIDTPFNNPAIEFMGGKEVQAQFIRSHTPLQRQGSPEEVAAMILYLCSEEASFVTAQAMSINGGAYN